MAAQEANAGNDKHKTTRTCPSPTKIIRTRSVIRSHHFEADNDLKFHPGSSRPVGSVSYCALNPMAATKSAGGHAGGASANP
eukprot:9863271-Alexandrium_andersonii.AAC.1